MPFRNKREKLSYRNNYDVVYKDKLLLDLKELNNDFIKIKNDNLLDETLKKFFFQRRSHIISEINLCNRAIAWHEPKCQEMYLNLLNFLGGEKNVRPGVKGRIREYVITCFLKNIEPDFKQFKIRGGK